MRTQVSEAAKLFWIRLHPGEIPDERRLVTDSKLIERMKTLGISEVPSFFIRSYLASFCAEHDKDTVLLWKSLVELAHGYLMEDPTVEPAPKNGVCWGSNARMNIIPSMVDACDRVPVTRYSMYFTTPSIIREYLHNVPQDASLYQRFLEL
ncbi:MAG: hypothetical protein HY296_07660 [Thaumarchaeota archaeon]|nr:hypothetical protein [Nitrososphaerota archaeon]